MSRIFSYVSNKPKENKILISKTVFFCTLHLFDHRPERASYIPCFPLLSLCYQGLADPSSLAHLTSLALRKKWQGGMDNIINQFRIALRACISLPLPASLFDIGLNCSRDLGNNFGLFCCWQDCKSCYPSWDHAKWQIGICMTACRR